MKKKKKFDAMQIIRTLAALAALCIVTMPTHAALVNTTVQGTIDVADATNPFGLGVGGTFTAVAMYDDSLISVPLVGDNFEFSLIPNGGTLEITLGSFTYNETLESFPTEFPKLFFVNDGADNAVLDGIQFTIDPLNFGGFNNLDLRDFDGGRQFYLDNQDVATGQPGRILLEGSWDFATTVTGPKSISVPEPVSVALVLMGLGMLIMATRRRG